MRILLDECVPLQVRHALPDHEVTIAQRMGWSGLSNGELLDSAERAGFDLFIVADKNLRYQQNLSPRRIAHSRALDQPSSHPRKTFPGNPGCRCSNQGGPILDFGRTANVTILGLIDIKGDSS
jgi:hypothetical protein